MSDVVICAEGLGKKYLIGHRAERERYVALRDVVMRSAGKLGSKAKNLLRGRSLVAGDTIEDFWALKDIDFEVRRGEVLGIIGRNGAGKSTLLKILSRITEPSEGRVTIKGRVASLLEVGTGFHPELTGRENIYLNGAILGMTRAEIRQKFDEIVSFAGIEKFLDTPVKRYSSGMYVRLAFAVAAHLNPEILIVDEVLAVGDAEFQKKCLGKISEIAGSGRTVFFVSHNMSTIRGLSSRVLFLQQGGIAFDGAVDRGLQFYSADSTTGESKRREWGRGLHTTITDFYLLDDAGARTLRYVAGSRMRFTVIFETDGFPGLSLDVFMHDQNGIRIGMASMQYFHSLSLPTTKGRYKTTLELTPMQLATGIYRFDVMTANPHVSLDHQVQGALQIDCFYENRGRPSFDFKQEYGMGFLALPIEQPAFCRLDGDGSSFLECSDTPHLGSVAE